METNTVDPDGRDTVTTFDGDSRAVSELFTTPGVTGTTTMTTTTGYDPDGNTLAQTVQTRDPSGNVQTFTDTATFDAADTIAHDGVGRLTSDCGPQVEVRNTGDHCYRWTYDGNGNLTSQVADNGASEVYSYSPTQPNEVTQATFQQASVPPTDQYKNVTTYYGYDGNGDTTAITSPVNGAYTDTAAINDHLQYDAQQRPITLTHLEGGVPITISLGYNADGLRSRYTVVMSGTAIDDERFQYRDGELAQVSAITATLNSNGSVKSQGVPYTDTYIDGPAGEPMEFLRQQGGATNRYWYALDGQGSVAAVTDASGKVVDRYNYDSWGEQIGRYPETVPQQLRYASYWYDSEMQWYWLSVRYYNPEDLRFLQPDPSDLNGVHTYAYADDDPVDEADPSGLCVITLHFQPAFPLPVTGQPTPVGKHTFITLNDNRDRNLYWLFEGTNHAGHILGGANGQPESPYPQIIARSPGGGFKDTRPFLQPSLTVVHDNLNCYCYISRFVANEKAIDRLNLRYEQPLPGSAGNPLFPINSDAYAYTVLTHHTGIHLPNRLWSNPDGSISERPGPPQLLYAGLGDGILLWPYPLDIPAGGVTCSIHTGRPLADSVEQ